MSEHKKALVFAGGGSKGAYQIGAWKALRELGESFQIACGTSIGSINAGFYVQDDFDAAYEMWETLTADRIMTNGINFDKSLEGILSQRDQLIPFIKTFINSKGADVTPFHENLRHYFDAEKFFSSPVDYALMTVKYPSFTPFEVTKEDMLPFGEDAWKWMAASGAAYPVFPVMNVNGEDFVDGGYYDNIPVATAFKRGATEVLVIDLKTEKNHEGYIHHPRVKYIKPSRDLGTFLNFEKDALRFSMSLGYNDTMKAYGHFYGLQYTFIPAPGDVEALCAVASDFIDLLTRSEASFDFSKYVSKRQRVNTLEGSTTILSDVLGVDKPTDTQLFIAALEMLLKSCSYEIDKNYRLGDLLYQLKTEADSLYPMLERGSDEAFPYVIGFIRSHSEPKNPVNKKLEEEDRRLLIFTAVLRALQQARL